MIFPELKNKNFGYINLNIEAKEWSLKNQKEKDENQLLDPIICEKMITDVNKKYSLDFSYGGWMEDRSFLWRKSYLEQKKIFTHLGVDFNVPTGTEVASDFDGVVVKIDCDYPLDGGWGTRIIIKHNSLPIYMLYAHLDKDVKCKIREKIVKGQIFAKVGKAPYNGNWFPHVHVQTISSKYFDELENNNGWDNILDGYGHENEITQNAKRFRDPMKYISLSN